MLTALFARQHKSVAAQLLALSLADCRPSPPGCKAPDAALTRPRTATGHRLRGNTALLLKPLLCRSQIPGFEESSAIPSCCKASDAELTTPHAVSALAGRCAHSNTRRLLGSSIAFALSLAHARSFPAATNVAYPVTESCQASLARRHEMTAAQAFAALQSCGRELCFAIVNARLMRIALRVHVSRAQPHHRYGNGATTDVCHPTASLLESSMQPPSNPRLALPAEYTASPAVRTVQHTSTESSQTVKFNQLLLCTYVSFKAAAAQYVKPWVASASIPAYSDSKYP